jgi:hypothetical protein
MIVVIIIAIIGVSYIVVACWRRLAGRDHEEAAADDMLSKLYGQYRAEVRAVAQRHLLDGPGDEEWLAGIRERAFGGAADEVSAPVQNSRRSTARRTTLTLTFLARLAAPVSVLGVATAGAAGATAVAYVILAIFLGGVALGVAMMAGVAVRKEDRLYALSGEEPEPAARGPRWLTFFGAADSQLPPGGWT